jgi:hypothetical protein
MEVWSNGLTAQELDEKYRKAKDLVEQNYRHIHRAESPLRHYSSPAVHRCLPPAPQANRVSTLIYGNPLSSTGFAVSFDSTLAIFREKEKEREGAYLPQECPHPQI